MAATASEVITWLENTITCQEAAARDAARAYGPSWVRSVDADVVLVSDDGGIWFQCLSDEIAEHVVYNNPMVVLRRCATDRRILALHAGVGHYCSVIDSDGDPDPFALLADSDVCTTVQLMAEGYGWVADDPQTSATDQVRQLPQEGDRLA